MLFSFALPTRLAIPRSMFPNYPINYNNATFSQIPNMSLDKFIYMCMMLAAEKSSHSKLLAWCFSLQVLTR